MRTIDLFSGCGGMSLGFENAGFDVVAAFDNWDPAVTIYGVSSIMVQNHPCSIALLEKH